MATEYQTYIKSLTPNHYMPFDGVPTDEGFGSAIGKDPPTVTGTATYTSPITAGSTSAVKFTDGGYDYGDAADTNVTSAPWFRRSYSMWASSPDFNDNYSIYSEGGSVRNMTVMFGIGGVPVYIADNDSDSTPGCPWSQAVVGPKLKTNTPYHLAYIWESDRSDTGPDGKNRSYIRCFLNGRFVGEKEIYKWDTTANEEILDEPGGQLNAHSGNIEIGGDRLLIVSKKTFGTPVVNLTVSDVAWWDNVLLTDAQVWELFARGATDTTATLTLINIPTGSEVRIFDSNSPYDEIGIGVETSSTSEYSINYTVASTIDARLVILAPGKEVFSKIVTLPREGVTMDSSVLLKDDRNYRNP